MLFPVLMMAWVMLGIARVAKPAASAAIPSRLTRTVYPELVAEKDLLPPGDRLATWTTNVG